MTKEAVIELKNVSKTFHVLDSSKANIRSMLLKGGLLKSKQKKVVAFEDVNLDIYKNEILGIVGPNGSGKSTLVNIILGILKPDKGGIVKADGRIIKLSLGMGFDGNLSGRENIYVNGSMIGLTFKEIGEKFKEIVDFSGLHDFIDLPVKGYSRGMKNRLMFSIAVHAKADVYIFDEFFGGVGDKDFREKSRKMFEDRFFKNQTVIFISHNMNLIQNYCDRVFSMKTKSFIDKENLVADAFDYR